MQKFGKLRKPQAKGGALNRAHGDYYELNWKIPRINEPVEMKIKAKLMIVHIYINIYIPI